MFLGIHTLGIRAHHPPKLMANMTLTCTLVWHGRPPTLISSHRHSLCSPTLLIRPSQPSLDSNSTRFRPRRRLDLTYNIRSIIHLHTIMPPRSPCHHHPQLTAPPIMKHLPSRRPVIPPHCKVGHLNMQLATFRWLHLPLRHHHRLARHRKRSNKKSGTSGRKCANLSS